MLSLYSTPMVALTRNRTGPSRRLYGRRSISWRRASEAASPASEGRTASCAFAVIAHNIVSDKIVTRVDEELSKRNAANGIITSLAARLAVAVPKGWERLGIGSMAESRNLFLG